MLNHTPTTIRPLRRWDADSEAALQSLGADVAVFLGDFGEEDCQLVGQVAAPRQPAGQAAALQGGRPRRAVILGNHDGERPPKLCSFHLVHLIFEVGVFSGSGTHWKCLRAPCAAEVATREGAAAQQPALWNPTPRACSTGGHSLPTAPPPQNKPPHRSARANPLSITLHKLHTHHYRIIANSNHPCPPQPGTP